jgi:hypothetical protein
MGFALVLLLRCTLELSPFFSNIRIHQQNTKAPENADGGMGSGWMPLLWISSARARSVFTAAKGKYSQDAHRSNRDQCQSCISIQ